MTKRVTNIDLSPLQTSLRALGTLHLEQVCGRAQEGLFNSLLEHAAEAAAKPACWMPWNCTG